MTSTYLPVGLAAFGLLLLLVSAGLALARGLAVLLAAVLAAGAGLLVLLLLVLLLPEAPPRPRPRPHADGGHLLGQRDRGEDGAVLDVQVLQALVLQRRFELNDSKGVL